MLLWYWQWSLTRITVKYCCQVSEYLKFIVCNLKFRLDLNGLSTETRDNVFNVPRGIRVYEYIQYIFYNYNSY